MGAGRGPAPDGLGGRWGTTRLLTAGPCKGPVPRRERLRGSPRARFPRPRAGVVWPQAGRARGASELRWQTGAWQGRGGRGRRFGRRRPRAARCFCRSAAAAKVPWADRWARRPPCAKRRHGDPPVSGRPLTGSAGRLLTSPGKGARV